MADAVVRRIALGVAYEGTQFSGFAPQANGRAVADVLRAALGALYGVAPAAVKGAARTDAGVHAMGQVVAYDVPEGARPIPAERLTRALAPLLPEDLSVWAAGPVPEGWDPVRQALGKTYVYRVLISRSPCPLRRRVTWRLPQPLDIVAMRTAAALLVGRHDFRAFRGSGGSAKTTERTLRALDVAGAEDSGEVRIACTADGFLYRMVRILVGSLVEVGLGRVPASRPAGALAAGDRRMAGPTAPPHGLCLTTVDYGLTAPWRGDYPH